MLRTRLIRNWKLIFISSTTYWWVILIIAILILGDPSTTWEKRTRTHWTHHLISGTRIIFICEKYTSVISKTWKYIGFPVSRYLLKSCQQEPSLCYSLAVIPTVNACPSQRCEKDNFTVLMIHIYIWTHVWERCKTSHDVEWKLLICSYLLIWYIMKTQIKISG